MNRSLRSSLPCSKALPPYIKRQPAPDQERNVRLKGYHNMVGGQLYMACEIDSDNSFAVSELSRFVPFLGERNVAAVKHLLRYLQRSRGLGLNYSNPASGNSAPRDRPICCRDSLTQIGLDVQTVDGRLLVTR